MRINRDLLRTYHYEQYADKERTVFRCRADTKRGTRCKQLFDKKWGSKHANHCPLHKNKAETRASRAKNKEAMIQEMRAKHDPGPLYDTEQWGG